MRVRDMSRLLQRAGSPRGLVLLLTFAIGLLARAAACDESVTEIFCTEGDKVEVALSELGWVYLGQEDDVPAGWISFLSKHSSADQTLFSFRMLHSGTHELAFQHQDNTSGTFYEKIVRVYAAQHEPAAAAGPEPAVESVSPAASQSSEVAEKFYELGKYQAALAEYLRVYVAGDPYLNDRIAALYLLSGDHASAAEYWQGNLSSPEVYRSSALIGLMKAYMGQAESAAILAHVGSLLAITDRPIDGILLMLARYHEHRGEIALSVGMLSEYLMRYPQSEDFPEALFLLGSCFEQNSSFRDLGESRKLYTRVAAEYPESRFALTSNQRIRYIEQHFLRIQ